MTDRLKLNASHRRLLAAIRHEQPVTRAGLGRSLGLGSGPVTQLTRDLILAGLLIEGERLRGERGQPALPLSLDPAGAVSIGISFIPGQLRYVLLNFAGEVVDEQIADLPDRTPGMVCEVVLQQIEASVRRDRLHEKAYILGIGFAVPGFFFSNHERMRTVDEYASWRGQALQETLQRDLGQPVWVENDGAAAALAEYYLGNPRRAATLALVLINYGIGAGLILDRRPFRGGHGNAGEIGALYPLDAPRPSGSDLLQTLRNAGHAIDDLGAIHPDDRVIAPIVADWTRRAGLQLATAMSSAWAWLDPEEIVIAGALAPGLLSKMVDAFSGPNSLPQHPEQPRPRLRASELGPSITALGAAYLPLYALENGPMRQT